jgi:hypothetical protein
VSSASQRRRHRPDGSADADADGFPAFEQNQWTFEGQMERWGAFARGANRATGWRRVVALALAIMILVPFVLAIAGSIASIVS